MAYNVFYLYFLASQCELSRSLISTIEKDKHTGRAGSSLSENITVARFFTFLLEICREYD